MRADELAIHSYKRSIALKPDSFIAWHSLGSAHLDLKQYKAASVAFQEAVRLKPDDATARNNLEVARYCIEHCKEK
jgi:cytochrome c-type biogenesis protein CcmH/NrfG